MITVESTGDGDPTVLRISAGGGNTDETEVHISARQGDGHIAQGWFSLSDLLLAVHAAGAESQRITLNKQSVRLMEPAS